MEFSFTKEEDQIRWAVNEFAQKELAQREIEKMDHVPKDIIKKIGQLDFLRLMIPEEYGGVKASWVELGIVSEEIAKANIAVGYRIALFFGVSLLLATHGTEEAKDQWLPDLCEGTRFGCISVTEPKSGSDFASIETRAIRDGDFYLLTGEKSPVSFGREADFVITFAKTHFEAKVPGVTAFLVPLDRPGIDKSPIKNMGLTPAPSAHLVFDGVRIPKEYQIGKEGEGLNINRNLGLSSDFFRIISGLICMGAAQTALNLAITHAKNRMAFGRPIAQFEAISGKIAEATTVIEMGRWLCYRALWLKDQGSTPTKEAAMCGYWCPKSAYKIIEDSLLIHGHAGYSEDYPLQQMLRDVIAFEIIGGTEEAMKLIIAEKIIGKRVVPDDLTDSFVG